MPVCDDDYRWSRISCAVANRRAVSAGHVIFKFLIWVLIFISALRWTEEPVSNSQDSQRQTSNWFASCKSSIWTFATTACCSNQKRTDSCSESQNSGRFFCPILLACCISWFVALSDCRWHWKFQSKVSFALRLWLNIVVQGSTFIYSISALAASIGWCHQLLKRHWDASIQLKKGYVVVAFKYVG